MKIVGKILLGLVAVIVVLVLASFVFMSGKYHFEESMVMDATPEQIHEYVGELKMWKEWGPWHEDDPTLAYTYADNTTEVGGACSWDSEKSGPGRTVLTAVDPQKGIDFDLFFGEDDAYEAKGSIKYEKVDGGTKVTWSMDGDNGMNPIGRWMMALMGGTMEEMFQKGLVSIKDRTESAEAPAPSTDNNAVAEEPSAD